MIADLPFPLFFMLGDGADSLDVGQVYPFRYDDPSPPGQGVGLYSSAGPAGSLLDQPLLIPVIDPSIIADPGSSSRDEEDRKDRSQSADRDGSSDGKGSSLDDLMEMDIISFNDDQIYFDGGPGQGHGSQGGMYDDFGFGDPADDGYSYDTDPDDEEMETCGAAGVCNSIGGGFGISQQAWRGGGSGGGGGGHGGRSRRLEADGLPMAEGDENESKFFPFDVDACCLFNPFDWATDAHHQQAPSRSSSPSQSQRRLQLQRNNRSRGRDRRERRGPAAGEASWGSHSFSSAMASCGCGSSSAFCVSCTTGMGSHRPLHGQTGQVPSSSSYSYTPYSRSGEVEGERNTSSYSLNASMEAVSLQHQQQTGSRFVFGMTYPVPPAPPPPPRSSGLGSNDNTQRPRSRELTRSNGENGATAAEEGYPFDPGMDRSGYRSAPSATPVPSPSSAWSPTFASYSSTATSAMASYFWPHSST